VSDRERAGWPGDGDLRLETGRILRTIVLDNFLGQNWLITPAALAVGEKGPTTILDQQWLLVLSGVVEAGLKGNSAWLNETVSFLPDNSLSLGVGLNAGPLNWAINHYSIPRPSQDPRDYNVVFSVQGWAPFACLSAIFDEHQSIDAGFAVNSWRPSHFLTGVKYPEVTQPLNNVFAGITVDVGVRDDDAWILKLSYHITLLGTIAFAATNSLG
jgi:hypothetical protein